MGKRRWILWLLVPLAVLAGWAVKTAFDAGELRVLESRSPGPCQTVDGVLSSEDITIDSATGVAYVSSADRREGQQGSIFSYDLSSPQPSLTKLTSTLQLEFHPHGISLYRGESELLLFVVNHRSDGHFIEVFEVGPQALTHRESISDPLMHSPNDVAAYGPRSFYVTNDHRSEDAWGKTLEEYLQLARSYLLHFDGSRFQIAAAGLAYANGVNISRDGSLVYVAAAIGRTISVYRREPSAGTLRLSYVIDAGTGVDNIELDEKGSLWIGAHPRLLTFTRYMADAARISPSEVFRVDFFPEDNFQIEPIYINDGEQLSASSVAAVYKDRLLIGSVADRRFLDCRLAAAR